MKWELAGWWECWWIAACRAAGFDLVNLTDGGDGTKGYKHTKEVCEKISRRMTENNPHHIPEVAAQLSGDSHWTRQDGAVTNFHTGNNPSKKPENIARMLYNNPMQDPDVAEAVAQQNRGRKRPPHVGEATSLRLKGVPLTEEHIANVSRGHIALWENYTDEERAERGKAIKLAHAAKTQEERSEIGFRAAKTRRMNKAEELGVTYASLLPSVKPKLTKDERTVIYTEVAARPAVKAKQSSRRIEAWQREEYEEAVSIGVSKTWEDPLVRGAREEGMKRAWDNRPAETRSENARKGAITRKKNREANLDYIDPRSKKVIEVDENITFPSVTKAADHYGVAANDIRAVCKGRQKTVGGHRFKYVEEP
jgi:hypothetical protein